MLGNSSRNLLALPQIIRISSRRRKLRSIAYVANSITPNANAVVYKNTSRSSRQTSKPFPSSLTSQSRLGNVT